MLVEFTDVTLILINIFSLNRKAFLGMNLLYQLDNYFSTLCTTHFVLKKVANNPRPRYTPAIHASNSAELAA